MTYVGDTSAQVGQTIGERYLVQTEVGMGEYGVVYRALDLEAKGGLSVALKTLRASRMQDRTVIRRIAREAEICMQLHHPNTARMLDHGVLFPDQRGGQLNVPYMVFELVRGLPLGDLLAHRGKLTLDEAVHIVAAVLDSLQEAHDLGIIHRDLKPNNILIKCDNDDCGEWTDHGERWERLGIPGPDDVAWFDVSESQVKVVDFGLGKFSEAGGDLGGPRLTAIGAIAGTAHFMSPEQAQGFGAVDHRADIYGTAMLLGTLLTGKPVFDGGGTVTIAVKHINEPLPHLPGDLRGHRINDVFQCAGAKAPEHRYASASAMADALRGCLDESAPSVAAPSAPKPSIIQRLLSRRRGGTEGPAGEAED